MKNKKIKALAEAYGIKEEDAVEMLINLHNGIAANPRLGELVSIGLNPDIDDTLREELEMSLGGYKDKMQAQANQFNSNMQDFDDIVLALAQRLYPNASAEKLIANLSKAVVPEGVQSFGVVDAFMQALDMLNESSVQQAQEEAKDLINQADKSTTEQLQHGLGIENENRLNNNMRNLDEIEIMQTKIKTDDDLKNLSGKDLIKAMAQRAARNY